MRSNRLFSRLWVQALEQRVVPATFTVLNLNDSGADSLRDCVTKANSAAGADVVNFKAGLSGTITLTSGEIAIAETVNISGPGAVALSLSGNNASRIFKIATPLAAAITISDLTLTNGSITGGPGGAIDCVDAKLSLSGMVITTNKSDGDGGAVRVTGSVGSGLVATNVTFSNNSSAAATVSLGGAVALQSSATGAFTNCIFSGNSVPANGTAGALGSSSTGDITLTRCTLTNNTTGGNGGFFRASAAANFTMDECTVSGNSAASAGGALFFNATTAANNIRIFNSLFSANQTANSGGALATNSPDGVYTLRNSTFTGNLASVSGGVVRTFGAGTMTFEIQNCTFTNNKASSSGSSLNRGVGTFNIASSVLAQDQNDSSGFPRSLSGTFASVTNSVVGTKGAAVISTSTGSTIGSDSAIINAKLGALANNGGPTMTHGLLAGSPCLNAGSNPASQTTDQRGSGFSRVIGIAADVGALEIQLPRVTNVVVNDGAIQRSRVTRVRVDFDQIVTFPVSPGGAFQIFRPSDGALVVHDAAVTTDTVTHVTLTFKGGAIETGIGFVAPFSLQDGRYRLTVFANQVTSEAGQLDGDNNGTGGDNYVVNGDPAVAPKMFRLFGDADGSGRIDLLDYAAFANAFNPNYNAMFDFDGDGFVNLADYARFVNNFQKSV